MGKTPNSKSKVVDQEVYNAYSRGNDVYGSEQVFMKSSNSNFRSRDSKTRGRQQDKSAYRQNNQLNVFIAQNIEKPQTVSVTRVEHRYKSNNDNNREQPKKKQKSKKKKNQDLLVVCNETTLNSNKTAEKLQKTQHEDILQGIKEYDEEVKLPVMGRTLTQKLNGEDMNYYEIELFVQNCLEDQKVEKLNKSDFIILGLQEDTQNKNDQVKYSQDNPFSKKKNLQEKLNSSGRRDTSNPKQKQAMQSLVNLPYIKSSTKAEQIIKNTIKQQNTMDQKGNNSCTQRTVQAKIDGKILDNNPKLKDIKFSILQSKQKKNSIQDSLKSPIMQRFSKQQTLEIQKKGDLLDQIEQELLIEDENNDVNQSSPPDKLNETQYLLQYELESKKSDKKETSLPKIQSALKNHKKGSSVESIDGHNSFSMERIKFAQQNSPRVNDSDQEGLKNIKKITQITKSNFYLPQRNNASGVTKQQSKYDMLICNIISIEPYFKRTIQKLGWIENYVATNMNFHIKFDITDKEGTFSKLKTNQWYNHFPNNKELTTKAGLCKNMWFQCPFEKEFQVSSFFPRCYDLSDSKQSDLFVSEFTQSAILSIIQIYIVYFKQLSPNLDDYLNQFELKKKYVLNKVYKQRFKCKCSQIDSEGNDHGYFLGNDNLRLALKYVKHQIFRKNKINRNCSKNHHKQLYHRKFNQEEIQSMVDYSQQLIENGIENGTKVPLYEQVKAYRTHKKLERLLPQYREIDGHHNVWVVKPSFNARGLGVYCSNKLKDIIQQNKKCQSKVVQKYIEKPLLYNKRKFDIRQWVLVTSWDPLEVYIFSSCYLKLCGSHFNLSKLSDQYRHLSNFSLQKTNKQFNNEDLVMTHLQLESYIRDQVPGHTDFQWERDLFVKIKEMVFKTMKCSQESIEHRNNCFEIYGFDIILDEKLNPWLIEVNLSPACNERTDWLTKMTDDMSLDLLQYLENKIILSVDESTEPSFKEKKDLLSKKYLNNQNSMVLNEDNFYSENGVVHKWLKLEECVAEVKQSQTANIQQNKIVLELVATKADIRQEKKLDKQYKIITMTQLLQRCVRGFLGRRRFRRVKQEKASVKVQRYLRRRLDQKKVRKIIENKASTLIQKYLRVVLAQNEVKRRYEERLQKATNYIALKVQSHFRRKRAYKIYFNLLQQFKAKFIQKLLRTVIAKKRVKENFKYLCSVIKIQKYYKRRFRMMNNKAKLVQKYLRKRIARQKVNYLKKVNKSSNLLKRIYQKAQLRKSIKALDQNNKAILIQSKLRKFLSLKQVRFLQKQKAQQKIQKLLRKYVISTLTKVVRDFRYKQDQKATLIQKYLRRYNAIKKRKYLSNLLYLNKNAVLIQTFLRQYQAIQIVKFRRQQLASVIKIQAFFRKIIAKKVYRKLKLEKQKEQMLKKKEQEKKFQQKKKTEVEIENYIESLFHKELEQQKREQRDLYQLTTPPPLDGANQKKNSVVGKRQSITSQDRVRPSSQSNLMTKATLKEREDNNILMASEENRQILDNRQQKELRIRKGIGKAQPVVHSNVLQNFSYIKNGVERRVINDKVIQKKNNQSNVSQRSQTVGQKSNSIPTVIQPPSQSQKQSQPKNFSENLMNLLAKQNIGQAFSENPTEAIQILKEQKKDISNKISNNKGSNNFPHSNTIQSEQQMGKHNQNLEYQPTQSLAFPKLNDFKNATNTIYLVNRPIADPRSESQFQMMKNEEKEKQQKTKEEQNKLEILAIDNNTIQKLKRSTDSLKTFQQQSYYNQDLLSRPKDSNLMILQAYKKTQQNPLELLKRPSQKRDESVSNKKKLQGSDFQAKLSAQKQHMERTNTAQGSKIGKYLEQPGTIILI